MYVTESTGYETENDYHHQLAVPDVRAYRQLHKLSTGNLFCSPPVLPFRQDFFRPIERYHRSTVSSDHLADVFRA